MGPKVPKGQTLSEAERRALNGDVESQDSQLFLERYHQMYAPGLRSSSPSEPLPPEAVYDQLRQYTKPTKVHQRFAGAPTSAPAPIPKSKSKAKAEIKTNARQIRLAKDDPTNDSGDHQHAAGAAERLGGARTRAAANASIQRASSPPSTRKLLSGRPTFSETFEKPEFQLGLDADIKPQEVSEYHLRDDLHAPVGTFNPSVLSLVLSDDDDGGNVQFPGPPTQQVHPSSTIQNKPKPGLARMEIPQSPTQSNNGRSYEQYLPRGDDLIPTESPEEAELVSQHSEHPSNSQDENRSLHEDDTGAINFDNINRYDTGTGTDFTAPDSVDTGIPAHGVPSQIIGYPETPAPPKNPFAGNKSYLLGSSQMFKQTQVSSACKAFSPTSSRPSPDNFHLQELYSPNGIISSPLKNFAVPSPSHGVLSSSQLPPPYETSPQQARPEQPGSEEDVTIQTPFRPMRELRAGLMESYKPMHIPQDNMDLSSHLDLDTDSDDDADYEDGERRRRLAMLKKMAAEKQLSSINIERRSATEDVVVPSTNTRTKRARKTDSQRYLNQCERGNDLDPQDAVEDSQDAIVNPAAEDINTQQAIIGDSQAGDLLGSPELGDDASSNVGVVAGTLPNTARSHSMSTLAAEEHTASKPEDERNIPEQGDADAIPETSPARLRPIGETVPHSYGASSQVPSSTGRSQRKRKGPLEVMEGLDKSGTTLDGKGVGSGTVDMIETSPVVNSSPPPAVGTKSTSSGKRGYMRSTSPGQSSSVSSLSALTGTPEISNKTTPLSRDSPADDGNSSPSSNAPQTSPTVAKANRRGSTGAPPKYAVVPQKSLRSSARHLGRPFARQSSVSTEEMARSPSSSSPRTFEQSAMLSRLGRASLRGIPGSRETSRGGGVKILTGMAFAISFQSKQQGEHDNHYNSRLGQSEKIADIIKQAGGKVLMSGFDELFEVAAIKNAEVASSTPPPDDEIKLTTAARNTGFTALIADGHSRKVKYMQALALGLPCIHERWITTCVEKQEMVDWSDYLLCAGNSLFLGEAIRSRNLPSYDVASAKLSEVIEQRPRLLHGSRILLVLRKKDESQKMAYVFLARVLGASLSRVYSMDEARRQLKAAEDAGYPYDWVYVADTVAAKADLFASSTDSPLSPATSATKKRKRKLEVEPAGAPLKRIRTLSNELVIQSLILGRLLEEGEVNL